MDKRLCDVTFYLLTLLRIFSFFILLVVLCRSSLSKKGRDVVYLLLIGILIPYTEVVMVTCQVSIDVHVYMRTYISLTSHVLASCSSCCSECNKSSCY